MYREVKPTCYTYRQAEAPTSEEKVEESIVQFTSEQLNLDARLPYIRACGLASTLHGALLTTMLYMQCQFPRNSWGQCLGQVRRWKVEALQSTLRSPGCICIEVVD